MIDVGKGTPLVLIPGIQGRWEWMDSAVDALSTRCRVITASLDSQTARSDGRNLADHVQGFDRYMVWLDELIKGAHLEQAALCGVSYGGWVALHYAAKRPGRVTSLTLTSTPSPTWRPNCRTEWYLRAPRLLSPLFALSSPVRLYPEIVAAFPDVITRTRFAMHYLRLVTQYPFAPTLLAERLRLANNVNFSRDCRHVEAPTQVITGDPALDRVVPVSSTREYVDAILGATYAQIPGTGHIGLVTKPQRFAEIVASFAGTHAAASNG